MSLGRYFNSSEFRCLFKANLARYRATVAHLCTSAQALMLMAPAMDSLHPRLGSPLSCTERLWRVPKKEGIRVIVEYWFEHCRCHLNWHHQQNDKRARAAIIWIKRRCSTKLAHYSSWFPDRFCRISSARNSACQNCWFYDELTLPARPRRPRQPCLMTMQYFWKLILSAPCGLWIYRIYLALWSSSADLMYLSTTVSTYNSMCCRGLPFTHNHPWTSLACRPWQSRTHQLRKGIWKSLVWDESHNSNTMIVSIFSAWETW